jgi:hypothetical protein
MVRKEQSRLQALPHAVEAGRPAQYPGFAITYMTGHISDGGSYRWRSNSHALDKFAWESCAGKRLVFTQH